MSYWLGMANTIQGMPAVNPTWPLSPQALEERVQRAIAGAGRKGTLSDREVQLMLEVGNELLRAPIKEADQLRVLNRDLAWSNSAQRDQIEKLKEDLAHSNRCLDERAKEAAQAALAHAKECARLRERCERLVGLVGVGLTHASEVMAIIQMPPPVARQWDELSKLVAPVRQWLVSGRINQQQVPR